MTTQHNRETSMAQHPDIMALRDKYDWIAATPQAQVAEGLTFLAGGYAAVSAWVIGFQGQSMLAVDNLITGIAIMVLTAGFASSYGRTHSLSWVMPLLGAWLIVSPWVVQHVDTSTSMIVSNVVVGACVAVFGLAMMAMARRTVQTR